MKVYSLLLLLLGASIKVDTVAQQYQPYPYIYPTYNPQNNVPYYDQVPQQQIPNYLQLPQQPIYYPVNQQFYPQVVAYNYPYGYGGLNPQQLPQPQNENEEIENVQPKIEKVSVTPDPFANVKTEIIDINPADFNRVMQQLHAQPTIISYENRVIPGKRKKPHYSITAQSSQNNQTSIPKSIDHYKTDSQVYNFTKTFVLHPGDEKNSVINLNFVNGAQVTESPNQKRDATEATTPNSTTTFSTKGPRRFIDVPAGCEDGNKYSATGGCFQPFHLSINETEDEDKY